MMLQLSYTHNTRRIEMKKVLRKCLKWICFFSIFAVVFLLIQELFQAKWLVDVKDNTASTSTFMEYRDLEENTVDVIFIGTSHVLYGIDPMHIYEETGVTSYVFGGPGLRMDLTYLTLKDALKTQSPKVIMLDASGLHYAKQQAEGRAHKFVDNLPLTKEKIEYAFNNGNDELTPLSVIFPFVRYHDRWSTVNEYDFRYMIGALDQTYLRGHHISYAQVPVTLDFQKTKDNFEITERNLDYFDRIVKLCEEQGVSLVVYKTPTPDWNITWSSAAEKASGERGIPYWELYYELEDIGLDFATDFCDETDHLNQHGAEKLSIYITEHLREQYGLADHRGEYIRWDNDLKEYHEYLKKAWDTRFEVPAFEAEDAQEE